jgi:hypothetical protein
MKQRQHRRTRSRVERDEFFGALAKFDAQVTHRSTSPMMGSTDEMTVTASETNPPRIKSGTACMFTKLGART